MERVVFVEVLDRRGRVRERKRLESFPAHIGRAYTNDVILADRYVSPRHLTIRESAEGELIVEDLDSENGVHPVGEPDPVHSVVLRSGLRLRLGETVVRLVTPDHPVAPAESLARDVGGLLESLKSSRLALGIVLGTLVVFTVEVYLETYFDFSWTNVFGPAVIGIVALSLWAGIWSFANRLISHRFDFSRHLALACLVGMASVVLWPLSEYAEFLSSSSGLAAAIAVSTQGALLALLLYGHLSILPASSRQVRRAWAVGVAGLVLALSILFSHAESEDFTSDVEITVPIKSFGGEWAPSVSMEEFLSRSRKTKEWVDEAAAERGR